MRDIYDLANKMNDLQVVFNSLEESAILLIDSSYKVLAMNRPVNKLLKKHLESRKSIGANLQDIIAPRFLPIMELVSETLADKKSIKNFSFDCPNSKDEYQTYIVNTSLMNGKEGYKKGVLLILHDVTEMTQIQNIKLTANRYGEIVGHSLKINEVFNKIESVKDYETSVLLTGETGTGKEVVARTIHNKSNRKDKPFIPVQITALAENIVESEIFGHVKGAFTGAVHSHPGRIKMAHKGTLFLDEIGTFPESVQIKLLRFLEDKIIQPVGSEKRIPVDVRIIAATNENLGDLVAAGSFREDLYYRLNVMEIIIPSLRERKEDIPDLIKIFIQRLNQKYNKHIKGITPNTLKKLLSYSWPGNVRELENAIEHAFILADGEYFTAKHFSNQIRNWAIHQKPVGEKNIGEHESLSNIETIRQTLASCKGNMAAASKKLKMHRTTLWRKMKEYQLKRDDYTL